METISYEFGPSQYKHKLIMCFQVSGGYQLVVCQIAIACLDLELEGRESYKALTSPTIISMGRLPTIQVVVITLVFE